jgi:hypothetical protein
MRTAGQKDETDATASSSDLFAQLVIEHAAHVLPPHGGVLIGEVLALTDDGATPLVTFPGRPGAAALRARSTVEIGAEHIGRSVVLMFENEDLRKPIIMGVLRDNSPHDRAVREVADIDVSADGRRLTVRAAEHLVLRCGKASIHLTAAGKVLIKGTYISSESSGLVRVKGAAVQLN